MSLEHTYSLLTAAQQVQELGRLTSQMWDEMDRLAAITAGRAALMNVMQQGLSALEAVIPIVVIPVEEIKEL